MSYTYISGKVIRLRYFRKKIRWPKWLDTHNSMTDGPCATTILINREFVEDIAPMEFQNPKSSLDAPPQHLDPFIQLRLYSCLN